MSEAQIAAPEAPVAPPPAAPATPAAESADNAAQNTAEQAPASQEGSEQKPNTDEQPDKRQSRRFERRLDKAYRRAAEAEAKAALFEKQLAEFRQTQQPVDPGAPRLESFKDIEEYAAAKAKYESERVLKEHQAKQQAETQKQQQARLVEEWESKTSRAESKYDDFDEVVGELQPTTPWAMAVMEAENAEDVAYYLGKHLDLARKIAAMSPVSQIREIGKIEAKLLADPPTKPKTPSKAPAPITPLKGNAPVATDVPSENDDMDAWVRKRNKQVQAKRR